MKREKLEGYWQGICSMARPYSDRWGGCPEGMDTIETRAAHPSEAEPALLDEPTNHLDIASREALEDALLGYTGTVLAISHDRYFVNQVSRKVWDLNQGKLTVYHGNYDDFRDKKERLEAELQTRDLSAGERVSPNRRRSRDPSEG